MTRSLPAHLPCKVCPGQARRFTSYDNRSRVTYLLLCSRCGHNWAEPTTRCFWKTQRLQAQNARYTRQTGMTPTHRDDGCKRLRKRKGAGANRIRKAERRMSAVQLELDDFYRHDDGSALDAAVKEFSKGGW